MRLPSTPAEGATVAGVTCQPDRADLLAGAARTPSRTASQEGEELGVRKGRLQLRGTDGWLRHAGSPDPEQGLAVG